MKVSLRREGGYLVADFSDMNAEERVKLEALAKAFPAEPGSSWATFAETEEELRAYANERLREAWQGAEWKERWAAGGSARRRTDMHSPSCPPNCLNPEHTREDVDVIDVQPVSGALVRRKP